MDRKLRTEIIAEVQKSVSEVLLGLHEEWITANEVCRYYQMFTPDWLSKYGDVLPRKKVTVTHLNGEKRVTRWAYARFQIAQNIADGVYDDLKLLR